MADLKLSFNKDQTKVVLIGICNYDRDFSAILPAKNNIEELYKIFIDERYIGIRKENVIQLIDQEHSVLMNSVIDVLNENIETVIIYYVGHGFRPDVNKLYLTARNTNKKSYKYTGIDYDNFKEDLNISNVPQKILIFDSCYSGITTMGENEHNTYFENNINGTYIISSSPEDMVSLFDNNNQFTFFTNELINILKKGITNDRDYVSLDEIYAQLKKNLEIKKYPQPKRKNNLNINDFIFIKNLSNIVYKKYTYASNLYKTKDHQNALKEYESIYNLLPEGEFKPSKVEIEKEINFLILEIDGDRFYSEKSFQEAIDSYKKAILIQEKLELLSKIDDCEKKIKKEELQINQNQYSLVDNIVGSNIPILSSLIVNQNIPESLSDLEKIAHNLWWSWNDKAQDLFEQIDPQLWKESDHSPLMVLEQVNYKRLLSLEEDDYFVKKFAEVNLQFKEYISYDIINEKPQVAFFCMEYGIHDSLSIYSGGLGILAGDYLKECSDSFKNVVGIGLLYRYSYFKQVLSSKGGQYPKYEYQYFTRLPIKPVLDDGYNFKEIEIVFPGRLVHARIWVVHVGRVKLYLLDTDFEYNNPEDRTITHNLYGGDRENRLKQELVLGIGGVKLLDELGISPDIFHFNEGHCAFASLERLRRIIQVEKITFKEAAEFIKSTCLFTTHTPVIAGHDTFDEELLRKYIAYYPNLLHSTWDELFSLGKSSSIDVERIFNMSFFAANMSLEINGVSKIHCNVSREIFKTLWPGYYSEELHINYVTNGIHWATWTSKEWKEIYNDINQSDFVDKQMEFDCWDRIYEIEDSRIWETKQKLRSNLIREIRRRLGSNLQYEDLKHVIAINKQLDEKVLTIVFAKRFAFYKRANLLFSDLDRLSRMINNPNHPVQIIFAGKSHPLDGAGIDLIKRIIEISKKPEFLGKIIFLPNYNMDLAKLLVAGADIWLNTPMRLLEASGTSGQKAIMNGTLHFSVLDGWWVEGYRAFAGWALPKKVAFDQVDFQNDLDSETIYNILEEEIIPSFYSRDEKGIPREWISYIKNSIAKIGPNFTTRRMINDYYDKFYNKLFYRANMMKENNFSQVKELTSWKNQISKYWDNIKIIDYSIPVETLRAGQYYNASVVIDLNEISPDDIGLEFVIIKNGNKIANIDEFKLEQYLNTLATFTIEFNIDVAGAFNFGIRLFPKNILLGNRQDFKIIKWIPLKNKGLINET